MLQNDVRAQEFESSQTPPVTDAGGLGAALREALKDSSANSPNGLMREKRKCFAEGHGTDRLEASWRWAGLWGVLRAKACGALKGSWLSELAHRFWTSRQPCKANLISFSIKERH